MLPTACCDVGAHGNNRQRSAMPWPRRLRLIELFTDRFGRRCAEGVCRSMERPPQMGRNIGPVGGVPRNWGFRGVLDGSNLALAVCRRASVVLMRPRWRRFQPIFWRGVFEGDYAFNVLAGEHSRLGEVHGCADVGGEGL
jgi:hypothetical protein